MYQKEKLHEEKKRILLALSQSKNKKILEKIFNFAMTDEVRSQDKDDVFMGVLINPYGRVFGWNLLKKNWHKIIGFYGETSHSVSRIISALKYFNNLEIYKEIKGFFKINQIPSSYRTIQQSLEYMDSNIRWISRDELKISKWLKDRK